MKRKQTNKLLPQQDRWTINNYRNLRLQSTVSLILLSVVYRIVVTLIWVGSGSAVTDWNSSICGSVSIIIIFYLVFKNSTLDSYGNSKHHEEKSTINNPSNKIMVIKVRRFARNCFASWLRSCSVNTERTLLKIPKRIRTIRYGIFYYAPIAASGIFFAFYVLGTICKWPFFTFNKAEIFLWGAVFATDIAFVLYRWTYRFLPNICLAFSSFILYILAASLAHNRETILGLNFLSDEKNSFFLTQDFSKWMGYGIVATIISTAISKSSEDIWHGFSRNGTGDYAKIDYRFKKQRIKLLSYIGGDDQSLKNLSKMGYFSFLFWLSSIVVFFLLCFRKDGMPRNVLCVVFFIAIACAILGFILHQFITDENLMRSESSYLIDRRIEASESLKKLKTTCEQSTWQWSCYCQVFANIYCSRNSIFYENYVLHKTDLVVKYFLELSDKKVCLARVLADLINYHEEQFALYCGTEEVREKIYIEALFAKTVADFVDRFGSLSCGESVTFSTNEMPLQVIQKMFDMYFQINEGTNFNTAGLFYIPGVSFDDVKVKSEFVCKLL